jgi:uncharacterized membrane protein YdjX (TVP38/TMEM64 family)
VTATLLGVCVLLFLDGATLGLASNALVIDAGKRHLPWQVAVFGGLASAVGAMLQLAALRWLLSSRHRWARRLAPSEEKLQAALAKHRNSSFLAFVIMRATPVPDLPLKLVAAVARYPIPRFGLALWIGAVPYYYLLARIGRALQPPLWAIAGVLVLIGLIGWLEGLRRRRRARARATPPA